MSMPREAQPIDESGFVTSPHRRVPKALRERFAPRFWRLPLAGGASTTAIELRPTAFAAAPGGAPGIAVVLHGLGDDATYPLWPWLAALAGRGLAVVAFDWDGHGAGGASRLDFGRLGESISAALVALSRREPSAAAERVALIGHSTGALAAALQREAERIAGTARVRHYTFVSPALGLAPARGRVRELAHLLDPDFLGHSLPALARYYGVRHLWPAVGRFRRAEFPVRLARPEAGSPAAQLDRFTRDGWPALPAGVDPAGPSCTMHYGERDAIVDIAAARKRLARLFARVEERPHARAGHWGMAFDPELPAQLADEVAAALAR
jgi:alpha-beta hydrolase superfamily lysophospholipase